MAAVIRYSSKLPSRLGRTCVLQIAFQWLSTDCTIKSEALWQGFSPACFNSLIRYLTWYLHSQEKVIPVPQSVGGKESSPQCQQSCFTVSRNYTAAPIPGLWNSEPATLTPDPTGHLAVYSQRYLSGWRQNQLPILALKSCPLPPLVLLILPR